MICDYVIALQRRMDDAAALLSRSGHREEAALMIEARRVIARDAEAMTTIHRLTLGDYPMGTDR